MKNIIGILILSCVLCSCNKRTNDESFIPESASYGEGKYFKDKETNLCFYGRYLATSNAVLVLVPCSPEVEKVIKKDKL